ncbi:MAG: helix-turn-helix transcriptional regulator [Acidimicrobiales bacterium]
MPASTEKESNSMAEHHFSLVIAPQGGLDDGTTIEALGEAGATDATVGRGPDGVWTAVFDREAPSFKAALSSAIAAVTSAGVTVRRVEPDDLVTQAEIAERLGRTSESIRLLASGRRGDHTFPTPAVRAPGRGSLWRWAQVAAWAGLPAEEVERAEWIEVVNATLQLGMLDSPRQRAMLDEAGGLLSATKHH